MLSERGDVVTTGLAERLAEEMQEQIEAGGTAETDHTPEEPLAKEPAGYPDDVVMAVIGKRRRKGVGRMAKQGGRMRSGCMEPDSMRRRYVRRHA